MLHAFYLDKILRLAGGSGCSVCDLKVMCYVRIFIRIFIIANNQLPKTKLKANLVGAVLLPVKKNHTARPGLIKILATLANPSFTQLDKIWNMNSISLVNIR